MDKNISHKAAAEVVSLATELYLPKGTEHFLSDLHGEYEAFSHIMRSASGVIRRKLKALAKDSMTKEEIAELLTVIYYPEEKLEMITPSYDWYESRIRTLIDLLALISAKYTREKVRLAIAESGAYGKTIFELLYFLKGAAGEENLSNSIKTVLRLGEGAAFVSALSTAIKRLAVDRLHIVGDIFDRGPRPDKILDELLSHTEIDIEWGNHDILWLGGAAGSAVCVMGALLNSLTYSNTEFLEDGYKISLSPLADFAKESYSDYDTSLFMPKGEKNSAYTNKELAEMRIALATLMWKLEGALIKRNPDFEMEDRLLFDKIDGENILISEKKYKLLYSNFPTLCKENPFAFSDSEKKITDYLISAFKNSEKLQRHADFLVKYGSMYKIYNRNLLFHGAIPMDKNGEFLSLPAAGGRRGKELMDYFGSAVKAAFSKESFGKEKALDLMWFLWCGKNSPLSGREKITTAERMLIKEKESHIEPRNAYYRVWDSSEMAEKILTEFSLGGARSHIINGHIPVKRGESPIKADGKLIVIDGGFCNAYQATTGIAGYTLIYNSEGMKISAHEHFLGKESAITNNTDIHSETDIFETSKKRIKISETDDGRIIMDKIAELMERM